MYSLSQFNLNISIEFMEPYTPSEEEIADAKLFANNVRQGSSLFIWFFSSNYNWRTGEQNEFLASKVVSMA